MYIFLIHQNYKIKIYNKNNLLLEIILYTLTLNCNSISSHCMYVPYVNVTTNVRPNNANLKNVKSARNLNEIYTRQRYKKSLIIAIFSAYIYIYVKDKS